jgi:hypothetical protein
MVRPALSEFSFGYAVTDDLIHVRGTRLRAAPVFPSLIQEGRAGGGWDLKLPRYGRPLFLQFKLADCMRSRAAKEAKLLGIPYYRMHLRPRRLSRQHDLLLDLEASGERVYYVAPFFHTMDELNRSYIGQSISRDSFWIRPSAIGRIHDTKDHYVAYRSPTDWHFCSTPIRGEEEASFQSAESTLIEESSEELTPDRLVSLAEKVERVAAGSDRVSNEERQRTLAAVRDRSPLSRAAVLTQLLLGAQLFIATTAVDA